jgi:H/ACA ribonucleoprotein complex subunit 1
MGRGRGGRGVGGRGGRGGRDEGPPSVVVEVGQLMHDCESEIVCKLTEKENKIPHFNAGIYLENKKKIGKVDEVSFIFRIKELQSHRQ